MFDRVDSIAGCRCPCAWAARGQVAESRARPSESDSLNKLIATCSVTYVSVSVSLSQNTPSHKWRYRCRKHRFRAPILSQSTRALMVIINYAMEAVPCVWWCLERVDNHRATYDRRATHWAARLRTRPPRRVGVGYAASGHTQQPILTEFCLCHAYMYSCQEIWPVARGIAVS